MNCKRCNIQITKKRIIPYKEDFTPAQKTAWETMKNLICVECAKEYREAGTLHKMNMARQTLFNTKAIVPKGDVDQVRLALVGRSNKEKKIILRKAKQKLLAMGVSIEEIEEAFGDIK